MGEIAYSASSTNTSTMSTGMTRQVAVRMLYKGWVSSLSKFLPSCVACSCAFEYGKRYLSQWVWWCNIIMIQSVNKEVDRNKNENINANDRWCGFNIYSFIHCFRGSWNWICFFLFWSFWVHCHWFMVWMDVLSSSIGNASHWIWHCSNYSVLTCVISVFEARHSIISILSSYDVISFCLSSHLFNNFAALSIRRVHAVELQVCLFY